MNSISIFGNNIVLKHMLDNMCVQYKSASLRFMIVKWDTPKN